MKDFDYNSVGAGYYDKIFDAKTGIRKFWHQYKFEKIESLLRPDETTRILDVGCAAGSFLGRLGKKFGKAVGVDLSKAQIDFANRKYGGDKIRFIQADAGDLDLGEDRYHYIVVSELIEHVAYDRALQLLKRLKNILAGDGRLILTTPNYRSFWPAIEFCLNRLSPVSYEHQHINRLDKKKLERLLTDAGFIVERSGTFFILGPFFSHLSEAFSRRVCKWETAVFPDFGCLILISAKI